MSKEYEIRNKEKEMRKSIDVASQREPSRWFEFEGG